MLALSASAQNEPMIPAQGQPARVRVPRMRQVEGLAIDDGGFTEALRPERLRSVRVGEAAIRAAADLDSAEFDRREAASAALLDPAIQDAELWALLEREPRSLEVRERLLDAACRRIVDRPRGALGIRMGNMAPPRSGVLVQATVPGLPADRVLVAGDVVQQVDGVPIDSIEAMATELQGRAPGQEVRLQVLRTERDAAGKPLPGPDGRVIERQIEIRVPLGNANELERADRGQRAGFPQVPNQVVMRRAIQVATLRRRFGGGSVVEVVPADHFGEGPTDAAISPPVQPGPAPLAPAASD
jgi:hypothetical protein